jgi:chromosome segregation ATPase
MNKETFSVEVEYYGDKLRLELPSSISISDFYYKLDTIAHFLTFQNQSIENVYVNRANEINNFEIHESIKELNQEIDTLENKIIELEDELKKTKETKTVYMNQIDELLSNNALMYNELQEYKEVNNDNCKQIGQLLQEKGILQNELQKYGKPIF